MEIPSTTHFDLSYKEAVRFLWDNLGSKVLVEQGICPYVELPGQTEKIENTIWPMSFGRLLSLELLVETWEIDPNGNGKKQRKVWLLNRGRAMPLLAKKRGRPETIIKTGEILLKCRTFLAGIDLYYDKDREEAEQLIALIDQWFTQPAIKKK